MQKFKKLRHGNWLPWKAHILDMLDHCRARKVVMGEIARPDEKDHKACTNNWDSLDHAGYTVIMSGLTDEEVGHFLQMHQPTCVHAYEIWRVLIKTHQISGSVAAMGSLQNFLATCNAEDVDIIEHLEKMKSTRVQLELLGQEISEQDFKMQIILSLPLTWEQYAESSFAPDGKVNNVNITSHKLTMHVQNEYE